MGPCCWVANYMHDTQRRGAEEQEKEDKVGSEEGGVWGRGGGQEEAR